MKFKNILIAFFCMCSSLIYGQLHIEGVFFIGENAEVHVWNDLDITTTSGELYNEGYLEVEGNFSRTDNSAFIGNPNNVGTRTVAFKNDDFNSNNSQRISGDMTGDNAFYKIVISNLNDGLVDMDSNIEITDNLQFTDGRLRTDVMSQMAGNDYQNEVIISNPEERAITGYTITGTTDRFVEGKLRRAVEGMSAPVDFPIGLEQGSEPVRLNFVDPLPATTLLATHNISSTTSTGITQQCDVGTGGANPDPFTPDGNLDNLTIDCVTGQWQISSDDSLTSIYRITLFPSDELLANCSDALYYFIGKDGELEDCPDIDSSNGITRTGLIGFSDFDMATASSSSSVFTSVEVIPNNDSRISLFPNPVKNGVLTIRLEGNVFKRGSGQFEIRNSLGQTLLQNEVFLNGLDQLIQIKVEDSTSGLHHLVIKNDSQITSKSFIIVE